MNLFLLPVLSLSLSGAPQGSLADLDAVELHYTGTVEKHSRRGQAATPDKRFDIYVLLQAQGEGHSCFYYVTERGGGGWAWPERFGFVILDENNKRADGRPIHVLHTHDGTKYPIELPQPLFRYAGKIGTTESWVSGKLKYSVASDQKIGKRVCSHITAVDNFGRRQNTFIEKDGSLVIAADRRVFMGRGDEFSVKTELKAVRPLEGKPKERTLAAAASLVTLQKSLKRSEGNTKPELSGDQLKAAATALKQLAGDSKETAFAGLVADIGNDVQAQTARAGGVEGIRKRMVGQPAPQFALTTLKRKQLSNDTQKKRVTVLHFWDYKKEPLEEPYGQVGYLDFLSNRRSKYAVDVVGVAVNRDFDDPQRKGRALASVRGLREFMNLSYSITTDSGKVLKSFGDPRPLGAKLPLWVVIGPDGKIEHYHAGIYSIKPDEGLKQLDAEVVRMIRKIRAAKLR